MRIIQQLRTFPLYIGYFLKVVDQHSLQAPFIYRFYDQLLCGVKQAKPFPEIEAIRNEFLKDSSLITGIDHGAGSRKFSKNQLKKISSIAKYGNSSKKDCIFLFELAKIIQPQVCIELGTSLGITTAYLSQLATVRKLYSFEGNETLVNKAQHVLLKLGIENTTIIKGNIDEELPKLLETICEIDFVFIDANHTEKALLYYYDMMFCKMSERGIMVIDDIRWSVDMYRGWKKIIVKEQVSLSIEFLKMGVLFFKKGIQKQHYILSV